MKYGPNTPAVERLLKQLKGITPAQIDDLRSAWDAARGARRDAAWYAGRYAAWDAAQDDARYVAWVATRTEARNAACDAAWVAARGGGRGAAWNAALALVVQDLISEEHFEVLYGPWGSVMDK